MLTLQQQQQVPSMKHAIKSTGHRKENNI